MAAIKWIHFYVMPFLGWYFLAALVIGLVLAALIKLKQKDDFWIIFSAIAAFILAWLPFIFVIIYFKVGSIRYERERLAMMRRRKS